MSVSRSAKATLKYILFIAILFGVSLRFGSPIPFFSGKAQVKEPDIRISYVKKIFPGAESLDAKPLPGGWIRVYSPDRKVLGHVLCTSPFADEIKGFGGPVPMLIGTDMDLNIKGVSFLPNLETASHVKGIEETDFLNNWNGLTLKAALDKKVDAVTGATITATAAFKTFHKRLADLNNQSLLVLEMDSAARIKKILAAIVVLFAILSFFLPRIFRKYRWLLILSSITIVGFANGYLLSISIFKSWLVNGVPLGSFPLLVLIASITILLFLTTGRNFYCSSLCPYGFAQEVAGKILKKKPKLTDEAVKILNVIRRAFMGIIVALLLTGVSVDLTYFEPFSAFLFYIAAPLTIILACAFLGVSVVFPRFWCRFLCPTGQIVEIFDRKTR
ncbi:MAG: 4Fe-4S binding protein [Candidatus Omnitrophica bacterium]|nr:4Fe-4S binding protein [Candidatus Omnitrophota bacterium]